MTSNWTYVDNDPGVKTFVEVALSLLHELSYKQYGGCGAIPAA